MGEVVAGGTSTLLSSHTVHAGYNSAAINDALASGGTVTVTSSTPIPVDGNVMVGVDGTTLDASGATFTIAGPLTNGRWLHGEGTEDAHTNLDVDHDSGVSTLTLPTGAGSAFTAGDLVAVESTAVAYVTGTTMREIHEVASVAGDTLTLADTIVNDLLVADGATFAKMTPLSGVTVTGLTVVGASNSGYIARFDRTHNLTFTTPVLSDTNGGILLTNAYGAIVDDLDVRDLQDIDSSFGYGLTLAGACTHIAVNRPHGENTRHVVTTLASDGKGGPREVLVTDGTASTDDGRVALDGSGRAAWDTHAEGYNVRYLRCTATAGGTGLQIRCRNGTLENCEATGQAGRNVQLDDQSVAPTITGGSFTDAAGEGVAIQSSDTTVTGATVSGAGGAGIVVSAGITNPSVSSCTISENVYGIHDQGSTGAVYDSNTIPGSAAQGHSVLTLRSDGAFTNNTVLGYGAGDDGLHNPEPGATISGNVTD